MSDKPIDYIQSKLVSGPVRSWFLANPEREAKLWDVEKKFLKKGYVLDQESGFLLRCFNPKDPSTTELLGYTTLDVIFY